MDENKDKLVKNEDGSYDYDGDCDISDMGLVEIPIKFNKIRSTFEASGMFDISNNNLKSLKNIPKIVDAHFSCLNNKGIKFTKDDVKKVCKVKGNIYV